MNEPNTADRLWLAYFVETEQFDRTLPGVWSEHDRDVWMPYDRSASSRFARTALDRLHEAARREQIPPDLLREAKARMGRLSYKDSYEALARFPAPPQPLPEWRP